MWNLTVNHPFSQLRTLQKEINDLFGSGSSGSGYCPRVNVQYDGNQVRFIAEVPGVKKEDIDINVLGNQLSIEIEKHEPQIDNESKIHRSEIIYGKFMRTFDLPYEVNPDQVSAKIKNGLLEIELPRAEQSKPKKIFVNS